MIMVKRKLKTLSLAEKLEVLEAVKSCQKKKDVAEKFGIPISTLCTMIKQESDIRRKIENGLDVSCKRQRNSKFPTLDEYLFKWFKQCRNQNISVSGSLLQEKADGFAKSMGLVNFRASNGWLQKFKKRHAITFSKVSGLNTSVKIEPSDKWLSEWQSYLHGFESDNIFNVYETTVLSKGLPDRTLNFNMNKCRNRKLNKERFKVLLAVNMSGTEKLKPLVVKLKPLKNEAKSKWMSSEVFENWLMEIDKKMAKEKRKILLFMDNYESHKDFPKIIAIKIQVLPTNTTTKLQPLNESIIKNFKLLYRKEVRNTFDNMEDENFSLDILQAMNIVNKAWQNVPVAMVKKCDIALSSTPDTEDEESPICFEDFVTCSYEVTTAETLPDINVIDPIAPEPRTNDSDDTEVSNNITGYSLVSIDEAKIALDTLRNFVHQTSNSQKKEFIALNTLADAINREEINYINKKL